MVLRFSYKLPFLQTVKTLCIATLVLGRDTQGGGTQNSYTVHSSVSNCSGSIIDGTGDMEHHACTVNDGHQTLKSWSTE